MELDKRIKNNHRPLCVIDIKLAMGFIGKNGFFADAINCFSNLSECQYGKLVSAEDKKIYPFECDNEWTYSFFIPEEWVKEKEPEFRPYTLAEWINQHEIGEVIHYRSKSEEIEVHVMYMGTYHHKNKGTIVLGVASYTLDCLFEDCEIEVNGKWQPFGVDE